MNDALRRAVADICIKFDTFADVTTQEINHISLELKRITGHDLDEEAHNLFMMFHYKHAKYDEIRRQIHTIHRLEPNHYVSCGLEAYFGASSSENLVSKIGLFSQTVRPDPESVPEMVNVSGRKKSYS